MTTDADRAMAPAASTEASGSAAAPRTSRVAVSWTRGTPSENAAAIARCERLARAVALAIVVRFVERNSRQPALKRRLAWAEAKRIDAVIVETIDALVANPATMVRLAFSVGDPCDILRAVA